MKPLGEVQRSVLASVPLLEPEATRVQQARGLVLAQEVIAPFDVPPFANSAMDGFAVQAADTLSVPAELAVIEDVAAGYVASRTVAPGTAIKIMTGAPLPGGADAVVKVEDTTQSGDRVRISEGVVAGENVRLAGGDLVAGTVVFEAGTRLTPHHLGVLTSIGAFEPVVRRRPVVAVLSTGDEVVSASTPLTPGKIHDSNRPQLIALLDELGADVIDLGIVGDDQDELRAVLARGSAEADVLFSSGGVSMGEYDMVKKIVAESGDVQLWRVAIKPAKPIAFGHLAGTPFFGLPGNPVSVVVAF